MLQWMGGSRRKVANSRKSTQKRQKQYFEQRKQQQQQQTAGSESYADGMNACGEHHKEQRSLDILSLLNLSTVSQECYSASPSGKEDLEVNASTVKYNISKGPPTILSHTVTHPDSVEFKEASMFSNGSPLLCELRKPITLPSGDCISKEGWNWCP